ncbi:LCP family protein [Chloroflexi bacterium TSY]|nr:LCP family protein [Chloroflexi bacterium TSY]
MENQSPTAQSQSDQSQEGRSYTVLVPGSAPQSQQTSTQQAGSLVLVPAPSAKDPPSTTLAPYPTSHRLTLAFWIATLYTCILLALTAIASISLYDWALDWVLSTGTSSIRFEGEQPQHDPIVSSTTSDNENFSNGEGSQLTQTEILNLDAFEAINVLSLGTDARPEDQKAARTDTLILLTLNPKTRTAGMLSLPRDLWVPIPLHTGEVSNKINMAYVLGEEYRYPGGGAQLAMDTVSRFVGQPIDYYVRLNFHGFIELVDLIGGIDILVPETIHDEEYPTANYGVETFHLDAGPQHMDGETALKYARTRNIDSDYGRAHRQQQVIRSVVDKVTRRDMIPALIPQIPTLFYTMRSSIDTNIPMTKQLELAQLFRSISPEESEIRQLVLDSEYGEETYSEDGAWILLPTPEKKRVALARFFQTTPLLPTTAQANSTSPSSSSQSWVRVEVLNGTNQPLIAARTRTLLESQGWKVVKIGDADRKDYAQTLVINYGLQSMLIDQVNADLGLQTALSNLNPNRITNSGTASVDVRIIVGSDLLPRIQQLP